MPISASTCSCQSGDAPTRPASRRTRFASDAGAGVDETVGQLVPRGEAGDARVGQPDPQAILEPPVELDEPADEPFDRARRARVGALSGSASGSASGAGGRSASPAPPLPAVGPSDGTRRRPRPVVAGGPALLAIHPRARPPAARRPRRRARGPTARAARRRACTAAPGSGRCTGAARARGRRPPRRARRRSRGSGPTAPGRWRPCATSATARRPPRRHRTGPTSGRARRPARSPTSALRGQLTTLSTLLIGCHRLSGHDQSAPRRSLPCSRARGDPA